MRIAESELIINGDGSVFHLHLRPEELADNVILVGDPGRVETVANFFESHEAEGGNREFRWITGTYRGKRITVLSTGIGCDNIDIVMNELDVLVNVDFETRQEKEETRSLEIVRIGTCGGLQPHTPIGTFLCSEKSIGFDGLLNFYAGRNEVCDLPMERALLNHLGWSGNMCQPAPYVIAADSELVERALHGEYFSADSIKTNGDAFQTVGGRKVYGGGGIIPDYFIARDTLGYTTYFRDLYATTVPHEFTFRFVDAYRERLQEATTLTDLVATISKLRPAQKLVEFADKKGIKRRNLMIRKSFDLMERYQFVNIIDQVMGTEASVQFENQFDSAALKALDLIKNGLAFPPLPETNDSTEENSAAAVAQTSK